MVNLVLPQPLPHLLGAVPLPPRQGAVTLVKPCLPLRLLPKAVNHPHTILPQALGQNLLHQV